MLIIGLTGGVATGKSTILAIFRKNQIPVIDADAIARKVLEPETEGWSEVRNVFGDTILNADGTINKTKLATIVSNNIENCHKLNSITYPKIQREMKRMAMMYFLYGHKFIIMEVPLLFETGTMLKFVHKIITVMCEDHQQLERLLKRNNLSASIANARIKAQMPLEHKMAQSHLIIYNNGDFENAEYQTECIIQILKNCSIGLFQ